MEGNEMEKGQSGVRIEARDGRVVLRITEANGEWTEWPFSREMAAWMGMTLITEAERLAVPQKIQERAKTR